ncbi:predicted amidophosphoribosyltransferases [Bacillus sp. OxB-1]|uniref:ComF family protein n=1 Tax=Bacillus sp. (strain OxB-1) TaxID=98228 RepID=UPI000581F613|nr:ComF family protein [Bacillus sp. OxB-1]BAQ10164.1 predicted amidophosphoribosyltransferases [Bacillus sp. OxB-1]
MSHCLLCEQAIATSPSWSGLLGIDHKKDICEDCSKSFQRADIIDEDPLFDRITSIFTYNEAMREYLHQYKFLQDVALAGVFANELRAVLKGKATVVPIPMHPEKKIDRTFAHVDELLKRAGIPFVHLLEKNGTEAMGEKSKEERLAMRPLFAIKPDAPIGPGPYILVDDIFTTGTTLRHAATVLKEAGATQIEAVTLIRAEPSH